MAMGDSTEQNFEWALKNGDLDQVRIIVEKEKALANHTLPTGRYPLCMAADYGQKHVIEYLIENGADVNVKDRYGISPLLSAIYEGHIDCVQLLLQKGASKNETAPDGSSYIDCASTDDIKELLK
jgi:ankyrin repeat protein